MMSSRPMFVYPFLSQKRENFKKKINKSFSRTRLLCQGVGLKICFYCINFQSVFFSHFLMLSVTKMAEPKLEVGAEYWLVGIILCYLVTIHKSDSIDIGSPHQS